jgi:hypothetical protein
MQHSRDFAPDFVTGQLLGMETDSCLEVSESFPFATNLTDEIEQEGILLVQPINFKLFY